jgi:uncharacterized membrane protein
MIQYIGILVIFIILYFVIASFVPNTLTLTERNYMVVSSIMLVLIVAYGQLYLLDSNNADMTKSISLTCILAIAYINWYYWSRVIINQLNKETIIKDNKGLIHTN